MTDQFLWFQVQMYSYSRNYIIVCVYVCVYVYAHTHIQTWHVCIHSHIHIGWGYGTKLYLMKRFWNSEKCGTTFSVTLLPGPLWFGVVITARVASISQIFMFEIMFKMILNYINTFVTKTLILWPNIIGLMGRVFTNGLGDWGSIPVWVIPDAKNGTWYFIA